MVMERHDWRGNSLFSLIQSDWREATESARSDVVSQFYSSCDSRTRVHVSARHKLAERVSDGRRVRLGTRTNNTIKLIVLIGGFLVVYI